MRARRGHSRVRSIPACRKDLSLWWLGCAASWTLRCVVRVVLQPLAGTEEEVPRAISAGGDEREGNNEQCERVDCG